MAERPGGAGLAVLAGQAGAGQAGADLAGADLAGRVWQAMRTLVLERYDRRGEVSDALGLSFLRVKALLQLAEQELTMSQLAAKLATDAPYTTVVIDDLEARGLVRRAVHAQDRRSKTVSLTATGRQAAQSAQRMLNAPPAALRAVAPAELAHLEGLLARLLSE